MERPAVQVLPTLGPQTRLLVVAPHPDDETIATGVLIQQVLAAGGVVRVLLLTAGDNNPWPQRWVERRWRIGPDERKRWGCRRQTEILGAMQKLGLGSEDLQCLGWPDMGLTGCLMNPAYAAVDLLRDAIDAFGPTLVVMPSLDDRHPDHGAAHVMIRLATVGSVTKPQLLAYLVHGSTQNPGYVARAGTDVQQSNKQAALHEHRSQLVLSGARLRRWVAEPERYVGVQARTSESASELPWRPAAWMRTSLRLLLVNAGVAQSWPWRKAPITRAADGAFHLAANAAALTGPSFVKLEWDLDTLWIFDRWGWHEL